MWGHPRRVRGALGGSRGGRGGRAGERAGKGEREAGWHVMGGSVVVHSQRGWRQKGHNWVEYRRG